LHGTDPDGAALFVNTAAGTQRLRHCRERTESSKSGRVIIIDYNSRNLTEETHLEIETVLQNMNTV